jgi:peptide/nickel transport system substrate-binding protein
MRRMTRRELVAGTLAPALASCGRSQSHRFRSGSTVTVLYEGEPEECFNPYIDASAKLLVFMPLVARNHRGELEGRLAESWALSPDFRTWTIRLRDGVRWHDGVPVTAHDMKFTLDLLQQPEAMQFVPGGYTVTVLNDGTYAISYHRQDLANRGGALDDNIACWPKHLLERLDPTQINSWDFWAHPVGCGPYRHVRTVAHSMMEFEANPDYFRGRPRIERVILKFAGWGATSAMPELLSGSVDAAVPDGGRDILSARRRGFRVYQQHKQLSLGSAALWWNTRHPLLQDTKVRRALTLAINRRELNLLSFPEDMPIADFPLTNRQLERGDLPDPIPYDPELANRLLDEAGWSARNRDGLRVRHGNPFRFRLLAGGTGVMLAVYVQALLKRAGVRMDIRPYDGTEERIKAGDFEAALLWFGVGADIEERLSWCGYKNPAFSQLLDATRATFDPEKRDRLYQQLSETFQADVPMTLLFPYVPSTIASSRIRGLDNSPYRGDLTRCMDELWLEEQA